MGEAPLRKEAPIVFEEVDLVLIPRSIHPGALDHRQASFLVAGFRGDETGPETPLRMLAHKPALGDAMRRCHFGCLTPPGGAGLIRVS